MSKKDKEMIGGCCVCSDERGWSENPLVYCDGTGCNVAVHQACYGIVRVPTGPWFCRKCESQERVARVKCELCPQRAGALKKVDSGGWCHVVCALYIPEACFANVQTMEPIVLNAVPHERFNKICYICEEQKRDTKATAGACMQCNKTSCKKYFHVTCAQAQGLLCEVMGSYGNVTYCGYCSHHYKKLKNHSNVKTIPAFRPAPTENGASDSSPEKSNPPKLEIPEKVDSKVTECQIEKSPPVDQSVSSTSDPVLPPPILDGSGDASITQVKKESAPSVNSSQVHDVSSAVSPSGGDAVKLSCGAESSSGASSDHSSHEATSSVGAAAVSNEAVAGTSKPSERSRRVASRQQSEEIEVDQVGPVSPPLPSMTALSKRHHLKTKDKHGKALTKKQKGSGMFSSTMERKERAKKAMKKRHDFRALDPSSSTQPSKDSPMDTVAPLPGHHDYCGNTFGGSPYFQSLSAPGHVMLPSYSNSGGFSNCDSSHLIQPPKYFPSLNNSGTSSHSHDNLKDMPLSMEQLLEQQWEQGANFLMQQGEHFDISSLLNCLHKLKGENQVLEDQVRELTSRRNHLRMVNARLALPLVALDTAESDDAAGDGAANSSNPRPSLANKESLEDISSPDDVQAPPLNPLRIPAQSGLVVEDINSPVETEQKLLLPHLTAESVDTAPPSGFFTSQDGRPQPLMYSAVNPPPPSLSAITTSSSSLSSFPSNAKVSSPSVPPNLILDSVSSPSGLPSSSSSSVLPSLTSSSSSSPLPPPLLDQSQVPSMSSLSLAHHAE